MNEKNELKLQRVKQLLDSNNIFYTELANGQLQVDRVNLWATSEKFFDPNTNTKGQGVNAFIKYLKHSCII